MVPVAMILCCARVRRLVHVLAMFFLILGVTVLTMGPQTAAADTAQPTGDDETAATAPQGGMNKAPYQAKCRLPHARIQFAAPAVGNLDHDAYQEIVVGTTDGWVLAVKPDKPGCTLLWSFDTSAVLNAHAFTPSSTTIRQTPAIADLDGDGWNEVVIPVGTVPEDRQNGGVVVLSHDGQLRPGWPQLTFDKYDAAYTEGVVGSPATADLDGDGKLEIIVGAFDNRIYAWHDDGSWVEGWPRHVFDTVWSSPAVGDLDGDGFMEVVVGVDAHADPYFGSIDGGALYVFRSDGTVQKGFPRYVRQNLESTPALVDLDRDGYLDIVIGGGSYYNSGSEGYKVHAFDRHGNYLPGWPATTSGNISGSPAIADMDGDGLPEVIVGSWDGKFYAWRSNGVAVPGWPVTPHTWTKDNYRQYSAIVTNLDGGTNRDGRLEILTHSGWEVVAMDAAGKQLTWDGAPGNPQNKLTYWADWTLDATPVVSDIDADGKLELIAGGGESSTPDGGNAMIYVWKFPNSKANEYQRDWRMFKHTPNRVSSAASSATNDAAVVRHTISDQMMPGQSLQVQVVMRNTGTGNWTSAHHFLAGSSDGLSLPPRVDFQTGTTITSGQDATFAFTIVAPSAPGFYSMSWRMVQDGSPFGRTIALQVKVGNDPAYYVLRGSLQGDGGGVYAGGLAAPISHPAGYGFSENVAAFALTSRKTGYYVLDRVGYVTWGGSAPDIGSILAERPAVDLVLGPDREAYYILSANGKLWPGGGAMEIRPAPPTFGDDRVRSFAITDDYRGAYVLDKYGAIYVGGTARPLQPTTPVFSQDIALKIKLTRDGKGYYVLDRYGRVHNGGSAPVLQANYAPHNGEDWARDFELTEDGSGYFMLDKFGGIHTGGSAYAAMQKPAPVWADGTAVDLGIVDERVINALVVNPSVLTWLTTPSRLTKLVMKVDSTLGAVTWRASANQSWLKLDARVASTPGEIVITADPRGLPLGTHQATVTIGGDGAANSPLTIPVQLRIVNHLHTVHLPLIVR